MQEIQAEYERNISGSYLKLPVLEENVFDERMLLRRKISGLLPVEKCYVNGGGQYWYCITGKQSLETLCGIRSVGLALLETLLSNLCSQIEILEQNLISTESLQLSPDLIFVSNSNQEFLFLVYPGCKKPMDQSFRQLMEYILTKLDHRDSASVQIAYAIYEKTLEEGYTLADIWSYVLSQKRNAEPQREDLSLREEQGQTVDAAVDLSKKKIRSEKIAGQGSVDKPEGQVHPIGTMHLTKSARAEKIDKFDKIASLRICMDSLRTSIRRRVEELLQDSELFQLMQKLREKLSARKQKKHPAPVEVVYPEDFAKEDVRKQEHPTICLSDYRAHPEGMLLYEGYDGLSNIRLDLPNSKIGSGEEMQIRIPKDTISHYHARIEKEGQDYYLEDMNSTNGTFVNDAPISYKERRLLKSNDIVRFADARYRFI